VIERFLERGLAELGVAAGAVYELDESGSQLCRVGERSASRWAPAAVPIDHPGPLGEAARSRRIVIAGRAAARRGTAGTWAAVPLLAYGELVGALGLRAGPEQRLDTTERSYLRLVGRRLGEAL